MRRTIRGRGARGFIEPGACGLDAQKLLEYLGQDRLATEDVSVDVAALANGVCILTAPEGSSRSMREKLDLVNDLLNAGMFDGKPSPLLCMRRA